MRIRWAGTAAIFLAGTAWAQVPADLVPAKVMVMAGWRGTLDPGPAYAGSKTAAILKESQISRFINETLPTLGLIAEKKNLNDGAVAKAAILVTQQLIRHPSAVFLDAVGEQPHGGLVCRPGTDAKAMTDALQLLATKMPPDAMARVISEGDHVALLLGYPANADVAGGLDRDASYTRGLKECVSDASIVLHVDVDRLRAWGQAEVNANAPADAGQKMLRFLDASGLDGVHALTGADGFEGTDWRTDLFVDAPTPRKGLVDFGDAPPPLDPALLQRVPASSNGVTVFTFDALKALATARGVAVGIDPEYGDMVDKVIGGATLAIGKNLQTDLLASLGTQWAVYTSAQVAGTGLTANVVVNKLTDPLKAKQAMAAASVFLSNASRNFLPMKEITIAGRTIRASDMTVYYIATPVVSPAWTVKDGYLYLGFFPQTVMAAARYAGPSIGDNADFAAAAKLTGGASPLTLSYTDTKPTLSDGYQLLLAGSRTLFGLSDIFLTGTPEPIVPPLPTLAAQAAPVLTAGWGDAAGLHLRTHSPFPGAGTIAGLSMSDLSLAGAPLSVSVLLPSLNRAREAANRIKSSSNLRQIGLACKMYANETPGFKYPADVSEILHKEEITVDVFINPRTGTAKPQLPAGTNAQDFFGQWALDHSDYVYLGAGLKDSDAADRIVAYEKPAGLEDGINVLFLDGHVEFVAFDQMEAIFKTAGLDAPSR